MAQIKSIVVLISAVLLLAMGCAKKEPPVSLDSIVPKRIVNLEASPREDRLLLEWTVPKENTDKSPLTDLAELSNFKIRRSSCWRCM